MQILSPFVDSSVDNVLLQTSTSHFEFIDIPIQRPIDLLLHDTAYVVSEWTEVRAVQGKIA